MCERQMESQVKTAERAESASSQLKASSWRWRSAPARKARRPREEAKAMETRGRPWRSMYAKILGAWCCSARAARVRDDP